jgi:uncharacterized protein (DUF697 family)
MAGLKDINSIWKNIKEIDLKPIRDSATSPVRITIAGAEGVGKHTLAEKMRIDPARPDIYSQSPVTLLTIQPGSPLPAGDLVILMVEANQPDYSAEQAQVRKWIDAGINVLVFINKLDLINNNLLQKSGEGWTASKVISGSANNSAYLQKEFVPAILELLPQRQVALGRQFPLFRVAIARQLINETCFSNAAYSFSTGLAEIVPVLDLPLNLTDVVVLTKNQAFLAYKLGLLVGFSTRWQDYLTEFGSVVGGGFVWRQIARSLIGLVPGWGIVPKVAIAYSGTYVVGQAVLGWYLSGKHLSSEQLRELSRQAFSRGKDYARSMIAKMPRRRSEANPVDQASASRMKRNLLVSQTSPVPDEIVIIKSRESSPAEQTQADKEGQTNPSTEPAPEAGTVQTKRKGSKLWPIRIIRAKKPKNKAGKAVQPGHVCEKCGKTSSTDAAFCQYCGIAFDNA